MAFTFLKSIAQFRWIGCAIALLCMSPLSQAADAKLKPFILSEKAASGDMASITQNVTKKLADAGFQVVGQYSPYKDANIIIVTNDQLKANAAQSEHGAFGAIARVTITKNGTDTQVAFTNPIYMANVYQMKSDMTDVKNKLAAALGNQGEYGPENGLTKEDLHDYHYKILMPYFTDTIELIAYKDQKTAIDKVEAALASGAGGVKKVYRVDLPGKDESVFGVNMTGPNDDCSGDQYIMSRIDFKALKSTGHLPYELIVSKGKVYSLPAEFRIAINFPDLSMMGSNSFASIMCAPNAIKTALTQAAGGKVN